MIAQPEDESLFEKQYDFSAGQIAFGKFEIVKPIGSGGMGDVYEAYYADLQRAVALKVLHRSNDAKAIVRFQNEARLASSLHYSGIATIYDIGKSKDGRLYMSMELVDGITLQELIEDSGRLSTRETIEIVIHVAHALAHAHRRGVVHRDIKPANIMITEDAVSKSRKVKVLDFGIARKFDTENGGALFQTNSRLLGSPLYMSPEQCRQDTVGEATDLYSLGCVMFECLTGKAPFVGPTAVETLILHQNGAIPQIDFDADLAKIVYNLLSKDPKERRSAKRLTELLEPIYDEMFGKKIVFHDPIELPRFYIRSSGALWGTCVVGVLIVFGIFFLFNTMSGFKNVDDDTKVVLPRIQTTEVKIIEGEDDRGFRDGFSTRKDWFGAAPTMGDEILKVLTPKTVRVDLDGSKVTNKGLGELRRIKLKRLRVGDTKITTLKHVGLMPSLTSLSLEHSAMGDSVLEDVIKQFPALGEINVRETKVTAAKIDELLSKVSSIRRVDIMPCENISEKDLELLRAKHAVVVFDSQLSQVEKVCKDGKKLLKERKFDEAENLLRPALASVDAKTNPQTYARILELLNTCHRLQHRLQEAHDGYLQEAKVTMSFPKGTGEQFFWVSINVALEIDMQMKKYGVMETEAKEWSAIVKQKCGPNSIAYGCMLRRHAESQAYSNRFDDAIVIYNRALKIFEKQSSSDQSARDELSNIHAALGNIYCQRGDPRCRTHWKIAADTLGPNRETAKANFIRQAALDLIRKPNSSRQVDEAAAVIEDACAVSERVGDQIGAAETRMNYGDVLRAKGNVRQSIVQYKLAVRTFSKLEKRSKRMVDCLSSMAAAYQQLHDWPNCRSTLDQLKSLIPKIKKTENRDEYLKRYYLLSAVANVAQNNSQAALDDYNDLIAANLIKGLEVNHAYMVRGDLHCGLHHLDEGLRDYRIAMRNISKANDPLMFRWLHFKIGVAFQAKKEWDVAITEFNTCLAACNNRASPGEPILIDSARAGLAQCYTAKNKLNGAAKLLDVKERKGTPQ
ncbi:MAG: serine/threonine protein kinase [Candidatus Obscuribacterales bacterium]|nr:serine/threonine protein kinase [Candidatus Obscuribacterales bacterium]